MYRLSLKEYHGDAIIPCIYEEKPYVKLIQRNSLVKVLFSKYGDYISSGYHDMSLFLCQVNKLYDSLLWKGCRI